MRIAGYDLCRTEVQNNQICKNMIYLIGGWGSNQLDPQTIADILKYSPASSSIFQLAHYGQGVGSGVFGGYDFGQRYNMDRYAKATPPKYDTTKITSRVAMHYSDNDWLAAVVDVDKLANKVQNLVGKYRVPDAKFNHMDFCWGKDAKRYVYDRVIGVMRRFPMQASDYRGACASYAAGQNLGGRIGSGVGGGLRVLSSNSNTRDNFNSNFNTNFNTNNNNNEEDNFSYEKNGSGYRRRLVLNNQNQNQYNNQNHYNNRNSYNNCNYESDEDQDKNDSSDEAGYADQFNRNTNRDTVGWNMDNNYDN